MATGDVPLRRLFIKRVCLRLNEPEAELFLPDGTQPVQGSRGCAASKIGQWVEEKCKRERLSLRQVATKTDLSHSTIADIIKGSRPFPETITKLAQGFGGDGKRGLALQDHLLVLAGYRTQRFGDDQIYLRILPLLSPECQHIIEALVRELAKIEGIEVPALEKEVPSDG